MRSHSGAARIVEALQQSGVRCVFGLPGTQTLALFEALRQSDIRTVIATNELSASFMAGGWARVTGQPGVLITISGPGFTWALTGLAEARLDSVPLLHIVGVPPNDPIKRSFRQQELPMTAMAAPLVKGIVDADSAADPGSAILEALLLARSGNPGPVLVHVSSVTLAAELSTEPLTASNPWSFDDRPAKSVSTRIRHSRRPMLLAGHGVNRHAEQLRALVEHLHAPVVTTPSARGVVAEDHVLNFGFDPFAGHIAALNELIASSDLVLAIGCKLSHSDTGGFGLRLPQECLVHIDASDEVIGANYPASLGVVADPGEILQALLESPPPRSAWTEQELDTWRLRLRQKSADQVEPRVGGTSTGDASSFFLALRQALPRDAILVLDSGFHQILARRHYSVLSASGLLMPTDLQSMGFAIPTAIGAGLAASERAVVTLLGDGGFAMMGLELLSAVREKVPLVVIVFNDGAFGQIRLQQLASYGSAHAVRLENPDFNLLALSIGARYESVGRADDIRAAVGRALEFAAVTVIEVAVGDSLSIVRMAATARARETTRGVVGPRLSKFLKKVIRRGR